MLTVEKDVYSGFELFLARQVVAAYDRKKPADPPSQKPLPCCANGMGKWKFPSARRC